ncbi:MAG TPA: hypothetical protein VGR35_21080 [Tepidisphaeraceae bacterium]|nr:hypothetical protein [Tepidisphaeraceae bacterium]
MRLVVALATLALLLAGCVGRATTEPHADGHWRVIPLNPDHNFPSRAAILLNGQTGDTWIYSGADQWTPVTRN